MIIDVHIRCPAPRVPDEIAKSLSASGYTRVAFLAPDEEFATDGFGARVRVVCPDPPPGPAPCGGNPNGPCLDCNSDFTHGQRVAQIVMGKRRDDPPTFLSEFDVVEVA